MSMNKLPSITKLLSAQTVYHFRMLLRMPRGIFSAFLLPVLLLLSLHYLFGSRVGLTRDTLYLIIGPMVMGIVMTAYDSHALGLLTARTSGVLKRLHGAPLPPWCYFAGKITATVTVSVLSSLIVLTLARAIYSFNFNLYVVAFVGLTVALGALAWAALGTAVTRVIRDVHSGQTVLTAIYLPLLFLSGTFSPFASEPKWMQTFANAFPARPIADGVQHIMTNSVSLISLSSYAVLLGWAAVGILIAAFTFRWE